MGGIGVPAAIKQLNSTATSTDKHTIMLIGSDHMRALQRDSEFLKRGYKLDDFDVQRKLDKKVRVIDILMPDNHSARRTRIVSISNNNKSDDNTNKKDLDDF